MKALYILAVLPGIVAADGFWSKFKKGEKQRYYVSKNSTKSQEHADQAEKETRSDSSLEASSISERDVARNRKKLKGRYYVSKNSLSKTSRVATRTTQPSSEGSSSQQGNPAAMPAAPELSKRQTYGYSYLLLGLENISYQEAFGEGFGQFTSSVSLVSPVLNSGSLFRINDRYDFSVDALATFTPREGTEIWRDGAGAVAQTNDVEYVKASTNVLLHYKFRNHFRWVIGPALSYQTLTRFDVKTSQSLFGDASTWEQKSTDLFMDVGVAYNAGHLYSSSRWRFNGRAVLGLPLWSQTKHTAYGNQSFNDGGYRTYAEGTLSYEVSRGLHLGWYTQLGFEKRTASDAETVNVVNNNRVSNLSVSIPEGENTYFSSGLQFYWNL